MNKVLTGIGVLVAVLAPTPAAAARPPLDFHDARYCELLVLTGEVPGARLTVFNTIGLNDCPQAKWDSIDAGELAQELGAKAVIKNGPRHFLMDAATGDPGPVRSFDGLKMRRVATIEIHSDEELVSRVYSERTNELTNTYQRVSRKTDHERHGVDLQGATKMVDSPSQGTAHDHGTVSGKPFGDGTIDLLVTFGEHQTATGAFTIAASRGSAFGTVDMTYAIGNGEIDFTGTADFTGGTGKYRGIRGRDLEAHDHNTLDGQNGTFELDGFVEY